MFSPDVDHRLGGIGLLCWMLLHASSASANGAAMLSAGAELDDESGYRISLGLNWSPTPASVFTLAGARADAATDFSDLESTMVLLGVDHFFGKVGVAGQIRWRDQSEVLSARTLAADLYFKGTAWRLDLHAETRNADFDPFDFSAVLPVHMPTGSILAPVSGRADCSLDNTAYGLTLRYTSGVWSWRTGGATYDYADNDCEISAVVLPPQITDLPVLSREIFRRIAAQVLNNVGRLIGSQLTRDNGFLRSSLNAGFQYRSGQRTFGLDYYHDREEFVGLESDTLLGSLVFPAGARTDLELRIGATDTEEIGTVAFAGAAVYVYLGGN